ncbi:MAG: molybdopterin-dependent oxidoreductase [Candidatus Thorarchaeota archaeon]|jgi:predicted molibdopterin-dependent oxidoreductase YjgC
MGIVHINSKKITFTEGQSILDIAQSAKIYIPTLCDHPELEPHGGCRMCLVEVKGERSFVTACTSMARDGMEITTETDELMDMKRTILQLLLKEHPSACIVCDIQDDCEKYRPESMKHGRVTGCTTCPNRQFCELKEVAAYIGIKDLEFDPYYKKVHVERNDPFFDRDYNLCILCARCYRVCEDVRGTGAICFSQRGHETRVDTAFGNSHIESGCWFCGACIDVCPTGSLYPRLTKWTGIPDSKVETTCMLCGHGCQVELDVKWNRVMGSRPGAQTSPPNNHHLCVLGRFCIPSLINAPDRLRNPQLKKDGVLSPVSWEQAIDNTARLLQETPPERIAFLGGPHLTSESAYLMQKLARVAVKTQNVDFRGSDFPALIHKELARDQDFARIQTLDEIDGVDWIISLGGDFVKTHQVAAKLVYKAVKNDTPLFSFGKVGNNLNRWSTENITADLSSCIDIIIKLAEHKESLPGISDEIAQNLVTVTSQGRGAIIFGTGIMELEDPSRALRALVRLAGEKGVLYPLYDIGNEAGVIKAGLRPDMLPGPASMSDDKAREKIEKKWKTKLQDGLSLIEAREKAEKGEIDLLYITDGSIPTDGFEKVPQIIFQSPYPSDWLNLASVVLPSASFVEESGTFVSQELRNLKLQKVVSAPGEAKEDWVIFSSLAKKLDTKGFEFKTSDDVWDELTRFSRGIEVGGQAGRPSWIPASKGENDWNPKYRGAVLAERIQDLAVFINALPSRDVPAIKKEFEDIVKELEQERAAALGEEVS